MPQKKLFAALLVAASALLMLGMSNENQIPYPPNYDTKSAGASSYNGLANVPESPYFQQLDFYNMQPAGSLILLPKFRTYQQTTEYTCGPAAALMVVEHFQGRSEEDELAIGKIMGTKSYTGTNTKGMVKYFKKKGWQVASSADKDKTPQNTQEFKAFVVEHLKRNVPIMVENVDWGGHWRVIIGYDTMGTDDITSSDVLIMADPYDTADHLQDGYVVVPAEKFFYMWFDSHLFAAGDRKQQWLAAEPPAGFKTELGIKTSSRTAQ